MVGEKEGEGRVEASEGCGGVCQGGGRAVSGRFLSIYGLERLITQVVQRKVAVLRAHKRAASSGLMGEAASVRRRQSKGTRYKRQCHCADAAVASASAGAVVRQRATRLTREAEGAAVRFGLDLREPA